MFYQLQACLYLWIRYNVIFKISLKVYCSSKLLQFTISFRCWSLGTVCRTNYFMAVHQQSYCLSRILILLLVLKVLVSIRASSQKLNLLSSDYACSLLLCMTVFSNITSIIPLCLRSPIWLLPRSYIADKHNNVNELC